jgi:D-alanine transaminase
MSIVYLNGRYLQADEARISVLDRGFLLADGVYEVTPAYRGRFFMIERHQARLARGLSELRIEADLAPFGDIHRRLLDENALTESQVSYVYLQITRGVAPRTHAFPAEPVAPTVYGFANSYQRPPRERWNEGFHAITVPDRRWARVDIKTINLLPNVMAQQAAAEAGVADALFVRDGIVIEGAHNNFFAVFDGTLVTHPASNVILHGITRGYVLTLARGLGMEVVERPIQVEELARAEEAFFTGTTTEIRPTVQIDGRAVGDGRVGPVASRLFDAFLERCERFAQGGAVDEAAD